MPERRLTALEEICAAIGSESAGNYLFEQLGEDQFRSFRPGGDGVQHLIHCCGLKVLGDSLPDKDRRHLGIKAAGGTLVSRRSVLKWMGTKRT